MSNKVSFIIQMKDRFSRNADKVKRSFDGIKYAADDAKKSVSSFSQRASASLNKVGRSAIKSGVIMTAAVTTPLVLMSRGMIQAASDAEEIDSKFNQIFGSVSGGSQSINGLAKSYKLARTTAKELLSDTGAILSASGLQKDRILELSQALNGAAIDLSSFHNFQGTATEASLILSKALLGEAESLKTNFGITIVQDKAFQDLVKTKMRVLGISKQAAKAEVVFSKIMQQAGKDGQNALGDFARTQDGYANLTKRLNERKRELSITIGKILLPYAVKLVNKLIQLANLFNGLSPTTKKIIVVVTALAAVVGPLLVVLGGVAIIMAAITIPMLAVGAAIGLLITASVLLYSRWGKIVSGAKLLWQDFVSFFQGVGERISTFFSGVVDAVMTGFKIAVNFGVRMLNRLFTPINKVRELLGFDSINIPELKVNVDTGQLEEKLAAIKAPELKSKLVDGKVSNINSGLQRRKRRTARVANQSTKVNASKIGQSARIANQAPSIPVSSLSGSLEGNITVSAEQGTKVKSTKLQTQSKGLDLGLNMAGA